MSECVCVKVSVCTMSVRGGGCCGSVCIATCAHRVNGSAYVTHGTS